MLCAANAIYSYDDLYLNFRRSFRQLEIAERDPKTVLVLGFGLGSVPYLLEHTFRIKPRCTGVDIDPEVVRLAQKYTSPRLSLALALHCADAQVFVEKDIGTFDLVVVDLFIDDFVPLPFEQESFLENVKKRVAPEGLLLYNRLSRTQEEAEQTEDFMVEAFLPVFPGAMALDLELNRMLIWENVLDEDEPDDEDDFGD